MNTVNATSLNMNDAVTAKLVKQIADRFRNLPFACMSKDEVEARAEQIESGIYSEIHDVACALVHEIIVHESADNMIKSEVIDGFHQTLKALIS